MKRISAIIAIASLSTSAFALFLPSPDLEYFQDHIVSVPNLDGGFYLTAGGFYLRTLNSDLSYQTITGNTVLGGTLADLPLLGGIKTIEPGEEWGYLIGVGYTFPNTGNDIGVDWFHFDTNTIKAPTTFTIGAFNTVPGQFILTESNAQTSFRTDVVNLKWGQFVNVGNRILFHPFAGVSYGDFRREFDTQVAWALIGPEGVTNNSVSFVQQKINSEFEGIGPTAGIDSHYVLGFDLGLVANVAGSLLIGNTRTNGAYTQAGDAETLPPFIFLVNTPSHSLVRVVPALDAKFGLDFSHRIYNSRLTLEAGYRIDHYFNVFERINQDAATSQVLNGFPSPVFSIFIVPPLLSKTSDLGFNGPYASLTFHS